MADAPTAPGGDPAEEATRRIAERRARVEAKAAKALAADAKALAGDEASAFMEQEAAAAAAAADASGSSAVRSVREAMKELDSTKVRAARRAGSKQKHPLSSPNAPPPPPAGPPTDYAPRRATPPFAPA